MLNKLFNEYYNWWKNIDKLILVLIFTLFFLGLFFSFVSTSIIASDKLNTNSYYFFVKHFLFIILGFGILITLSIINQKKLINFSIFFFIISLIFLFLVPIFGVEVKGSKRWIDFAFLPRFQPIELMKPFLVMFLSLILTYSKIKSLYFRFLISLIFIIPVVLLLISQPDLGQTILLMLVWLSLIFVSGVSLIIFFSFFAFLSTIISYLIFFVPKFSYIKIRLLSFFDSSSLYKNQSDRALEAIMNGGLLGKGIGEGTLNSKVPEAHTDFIISVISEEFGAISVIIIMLIYLFLSFKVMKKLDQKNDNKIKLILLGLITLILLQTFIHIGVNLRMLPTTGMTLPFLSYGGSSIISTSIISGIILNFTRREIKY